MVIYKNRIFNKLFSYVTFLSLIKASLSFGDEKGPDGYIFCAREGQSFLLPKLCHIAYGRYPSFVYKFNQTGSITFDNETFGDPTWGSTKHGFYKIADGSESAEVLLDAFQKATDHGNGINSLSSSLLNKLTYAIKQNIFLIADSRKIIQSAFDAIESYEIFNSGAIFLNDKTNKGFPNKPQAEDGYEYDRLIFTIQQALHDFVYTKENLNLYKDLLQGKTYSTADHFPGNCPSPEAPYKSFTATINASMPSDWGFPTAWSKTYATRPIGYYLPSGSIGKITVPDSMVGQGYEILVGAHTSDHTSKPIIERFFRIFQKFEITSRETLVANPFGGGVYINVPYKASAGLQKIKISNVVASPFFSFKSFHMTTEEEWKNIQRKNPGPWADFESEKFMMQVPTAWIYNFDDAKSVMEDWDARMDAVSYILGYQPIRNNTVLYLQVDTRIKGGMYSIGYPQVNVRTDPWKLTNPIENRYGNYSQHWYLSRNIDSAFTTEMHELGHAQLPVGFPGEGESYVHILAAAIYNLVFNYNIDEAFGLSEEYRIYRTREQVALNWMVTENFRNGNPMNISNSTKSEVRYQERGHAKYVEIAALFGWKTIRDFHYQGHLNYTKSVTPLLPHKIDDRILKLSIAAGADLRPLIHFWGVHPQDQSALSSAMADKGLSVPDEMYQRLKLYQSIIPMTNREFKVHAKTFFGGNVPKGGHPDYAFGWYNVWLDKYNQSHGLKANKAIQKIIDLYYNN